VLVAEILFSAAPTSGRRNDMIRILSAAAVLGFLALPAFAQTCTSEDGVITPVQQTLEDTDEPILYQGYSGHPVYAKAGKGVSGHNQTTKTGVLITTYPSGECPPELTGSYTVTTVYGVFGPGESDTERHISSGTTCETTPEGYCEAVLPDLD
jgi:hypothetical protein